MKKNSHSDLSHKYFCFGFSRAHEKNFFTIFREFEKKKHVNLNDNNLYFNLKIQIL